MASGDVVQPRQNVRPNSVVFVRDERMRSSGNLAPEPLNTFYASSAENHSLLGGGHESPVQDLVRLYLKEWLGRGRSTEQTRICICRW